MGSPVGAGVGIEEEDVHVMGKRFAMGMAGIAAGFMLMAGVVVGDGRSVSAQDDMMMAGMPAHLHVGACDAPGEVVAPLSDVSAALNVDATPMAGAEMMGQETALPVYASITTVALPLADIVSGGHSLVVHESAENIQNYVACGAIGGYMLGDTDIPFGIGSLNDSGMTGIGWLTDNGDGTTTVRVFLTMDSHDMGEMEGDDMGEMDDMEGTPEA